jgi:hypothetical protein
MWASGWTEVRSWSARQGSLLNRYRGIRRASGSLVSIGAWPVVACCVNPETTRKRRSARVALSTE